jgi:hypothetical protein
MVLYSSDMIKTMYDVWYVNSAILKGSGRGFLEVNEIVDAEQLQRLKQFPFVKGLKVIKEYSE